MLDISVQTIPHKQQRYETVGDYVSTGADGRQRITVSDLGNWRYEILVAIHELVELALVNHAGISVQSIDDFDMQFEAERKAFIHGKDDEPGDDPAAPYHLQHGLASSVERMLCAAMGLSWKEYAEIVGSLYNGKKSLLTNPPAKRKPRRKIARKVS